MMKESKLTVGSLIPNTGFVIPKPTPHFYPSKQPRKSEVIHLLQNHLTFTVQPSKGQLLLEAAIQQGQKINFKCRKGTCGVCAVKVEAGETLLCPAGKKEHKKLKNAVHFSYRLACQAVMK